MGSLYIKDAGVADRAARVARRLGTTKTDAVRRGLTALEEQLPPEQSVADDFVERLRGWQRDYPLGPSTGLEADKAFYDSLYE